MIGPADSLRPENFIEFIHSKIFDRTFDKIGLDDEDLLALQAAVMLDPKRWPVISKTGGARKLRFVPRGWPFGKRGALRVIYAYFESHRTVLLVLIYPKREKEDITPDEKKLIRKELAEVEAALSQKR